MLAARLFLALGHQHVEACDDLGASVGRVDDLVDVAALSGDVRVRILVEVVVDQLVLASCLLYTSPSPRDKRQSRIPSSA